MVVLSATTLLQQLEALRVTPGIVAGSGQRRVKNHRASVRVPVSSTPKVTRKPLPSLLDGIYRVSEKRPEAAAREVTPAAEVAPAVEVVPKRTNEGVNASCCSGHRFRNGEGNLFRFGRGGQQCPQQALPSPRQFRLLRELGSGSLGTNYKAVTTGNNMVVSLKVIRKERLLKNALDRRVVTNEQQLLSKLNHRFVAKFYCSAQTSQHLLLATEFLPDHTLQTLVSRTRRGVGLPPLQAAVVMAELASALGYLHENQVLHGNIRPENVRVDANGHARLAGFNYAQSCFPSHRSMVRPPPSGKSKHAFTMMEFQAPELKRGLPHGHAADWYSYGAVLFFLLTGQHPPPTQSLGRIVWQNGAALAAQIGADAVDLLLSLLQEDPARRANFKTVRHHPFFAHLDWEEINEGEGESGIGQLDEMRQVDSSRRMAHERFWREPEANNDPNFYAWSKIEASTSKLLFGE